MTSQDRQEIAEALRGLATTHRSLGLEMGMLSRGDPMSQGLGARWHYARADRLEQLASTAATTGVIELIGATEQQALWRWVYALTLGLAKLLLHRANEQNRALGRPGDWPAQQTWDELAGSSHGVFLERARRLAGVPHADFLEYARGARGAQFAEIAAQLYADVLERIRAVRPDAVLHATFSGRVLVHPGPLPAPYSDRWGVGFPEHTGGGNAGGTVVLTQEHLEDRALWAHECAHLITGITEHPAWLFEMPGLALNV